MFGTFGDQAIDPLKIFECGELNCKLAARVAQERFEQSIANGPRTLAPGESAEAEFAIVGLPDGTRNDLSADNAFTILINNARRETKVAALTTPVSTTTTEATHP